jgi:hypothetical protein
VIAGSGFGVRSASAVKEKAGRELLCCCVEKYLDIVGL